MHFASAFKSNCCKYNSRVLNKLEPKKYISTHLLHWGIKLLGLHPLKAGPRGKKNLPNFFYFVKYFNHWPAVCLPKVLFNVSCVLPSIHNNPEHWTKETAGETVKRAGRRLWGTTCFTGLSRFYCFIKYAFRSMSWSYALISSNYNNVV